MFFRAQITANRYKFFAGEGKEPYYYRTIAAGLECLMTLAHVHYKTPLFPDEWRRTLTV